MDLDCAYGSDCKSLDTPLTSKDEANHNIEITTSAQQQSGGQVGISYSVCMVSSSVGKRKLEDLIDESTIGSWPSSSSVLESPVKRIKQDKQVWNHGGGKRVISSCYLKFNTKDGSKQIETRIMLDTGATVSVCDPKFMSKHRIPYSRRENPINLSSADGTLIEGAGKYVTRSTDLVIRDKIRHGYRVAPITCEVFPLEQNIDMIVGMDWVNQNVELLNIKANRNGAPIDEIIKFNDDVPVEDEVIEITKQVEWDRLFEDEEVLHIATIQIQF